MPSPSESTIDRFMAEVRTTGLAKNNRFAVAMQYPAELNRLAGVDPSLNFANPNDLRKALLFCESVQLPGWSFATIQNRTYGEFREIPYEKLYEPITMTFYVDNDLRVKHMFDEWATAIQNPVTRSFGYYKDYATNMEIMVYDLLNRETYRVFCSECYPKSVGAIQMDNNNKEFMRLTVTMQIKFWTAHPAEYMSNVNRTVPSAGLLGFYSQQFDTFQSAFNNFNSNAMSQIPGIQGGGLPGLNGIANDAQNFISGIQNNIRSGINSVANKVNNFLGFG